jgi:hypothetical protein
LEEFLLGLTSGKAWPCIGQNNETSIGLRYENYRIHVTVNYKDMPFYSPSHEFDEFVSNKV